MKLVLVALVGAVHLKPELVEEVIAAEAAEEEEDPVKPTALALRKH